MVASSQPLTGDLRKAFIDTGLQHCVPKEKLDFEQHKEEVEKQGLSEDRVELYCRCLLEYSADVITWQEMEEIGLGKSAEFFDK